MDVASGTNNTSSVIVKKEPVFEAECIEYESFYTQSNRPGRGWRRSRRSFEEHSGEIIPGTGATGRKKTLKSIRSNGTRNDERKDIRSGERMVKRKNPTDSYGKVTTCKLCGSVYHWVRDCPERGSYEKEGINVFSNEIQREYLPIFLKETLNCTVLDRGCVRSVCGKKWLESYVKSLAPDNVKSIQEVPSHTRFRFGVGGLVYESEKHVKFPALIGTRKVFLEADLIDCDLPLLLSKESMKKADTHINFKNDEVTMLGQKLKLKFTSSGHYAITLMGHYHLNGTVKRQSRLYFSNFKKWTKR